MIISIIYGHDDKNNPQEQSKATQVNASDQFNSLFLNRSDGQSNLKRNFDQNPPQKGSTASLINSGNMEEFPEKPISFRRTIKQNTIPEESQYHQSNISSQPNPDDFDTPVYELDNDIKSTKQSTDTSSLDKKSYDQKSESTIKTDKHLIPSDKDKSNTQTDKHSTPLNKDENNNMGVLPVVLGASAFFIGGGYLVWPNTQENTNKKPKKSIKKLTKSPKKK